MTELKGANGQISFDGRTVTITRKGMRAALVSGGFGAEKQLHISAITAVQYKKAGLNLGYIQLSVPGEVVAQRRNKTQTLQQDENTITFYSGGNADFKALADELNAAIHAKHEPVAAAPDIADQLRKLGELRDSGVLTQAEFDAKKAELLARM